MLNENANKYMHKFSGKDGLIKFERFFRNKFPQNLLPVCKQFGSMREDDTLLQLHLSSGMSWLSSAVQHRFGEHYCSKIKSLYDLSASQQLFRHTYIWAQM